MGGRVEKRENMRVRRGREGAGGGGKGGGERGKRLGRGRRREGRSHEKASHLRDDLGLSNGCDGSNVVSLICQLLPHVPIYSNKPYINLYLYRAQQLQNL